MPLLNNNRAVSASPIRGAGLGLRTPHYRYIEEHKPDVPWFEVLIDNYIADGGLPLYHLEQIRKDYPVTFHGVSMSLGSTDPLNMKYLKRLKQRCKEFAPTHISDHLCWTSFGGQHAHELLPLPYTDEAIQHVIDRIRVVQDFLGQQILIENVSSYLSYNHSVMKEWEFLSAIADEADCLILLDVNNIYVSACNHHENAIDYLNHIPIHKVKEIHLAGYEDMGSHLLDTHGQAVHPPVWRLYQQTLNRFGCVPTLIEWDNNIPEFEVLLAEAQQANHYMMAQHNDVA